MGILICSGGNATTWPFSMICPQVDPVRDGWANRCARPSPAHPPGFASQARRKAGRPLDHGGCHGVTCIGISGETASSFGLEGGDASRCLMKASLGLSTSGSVIGHQVRRQVREGADSRPAEEKVLQRDIPIGPSDASLSSGKSRRTGCSTPIVLNNKRAAIAQAPISNRNHVEVVVHQGLGRLPGPVRPGSRGSRCCPPT